MRRTAVTDIEVTILAETSNAVLISDDGDRSYGYWLPKAQIEIEGDILDSVATGSRITITMPKWLAQKKGYVW